MFSQRCPQCNQIFTANFCGEATCRRKFIFLPELGRDFCPLHDPKLATPGERRIQKFQKALSCPVCGRNLFGMKHRDSPVTSGTGKSE